MKWIEKEKPAPFKEGDTKKCVGFLLFPKKIGKETRWLCFAKWIERFEYIQFGRGRKIVWNPNKWVDHD